MRVHLLGTGSADGWPNPFCACASCESQRATGASRASTAALIDGSILVDCGPTAAMAVSRAGADLTSVQHVLLTHGHPDHLAPDFLLWRQWIPGLHPLHLWGPAGALARCTDWIGPAAAIHLHPIVPGEALDLPVVDQTGSAATYRLSVHAAQHAHGDGDELAAEAVLFGIEAPDGTSLLYATDTGRLPRSELGRLRDRAFDLALVDATFGTHVDHGTGHLDFATLPRFLQDLREVGALTAGSDVVAVHLSHHNPPLAELTGILARIGARVVDDLTVVEVPSGPARLRHLVLGGARSGKSRFAEALAGRFGQVTYIATAPPQPGDQEWADRVTEHQRRRPAHWRTLETTDLVTALADIASGEVALVECLGMWLTAQLDAADAWSQDRQVSQAGVTRVLAHVDALVAAVQAAPGSVIVVSNEVGMDVVPATISGRLFRDLLGRINARLAASCEQVTLVVAGRALPLPAGSHLVPGG